MSNSNKDDRKALIPLLILSVGLIVYLSINNWARPSVTATEVSPQVIRDTIYLPDSTSHTDAGVLTPTPKDTLPIVTNRYPGPPKKVNYPKKLAKGSTIDLNSADTLMLMRVPGIGVSFARRIYKYRALLGGYYVKEQLQEVYGMDRQLYDQIAPYLTIKTPVHALVVSRDSIPRHPYLQWQHKRTLERLLKSGKEITWDLLMQEGSFSRDDSLRLAPYLVFPSTADKGE